MRVPTSGFGDIPKPSESEMERSTRLLREQREAIRDRLKREFDVPAEFEQLAISIWLDGKYD